MPTITIDDDALIIIKANQELLKNNGLVTTYSGVIRELFNLSKLATNDELKLILASLKQELITKQDEVSNNGEN